MVAESTEMDVDTTDKDPFDTSEFDSSAFDAFSNKFDSTATTAVSGKSTSSGGFDAFASPLHITKSPGGGKNETSDGFDVFDPYAGKAGVNIPGTKVPRNTPLKKKDESKDSFDDDDEEDNLKIVIRAKMTEKSSTGSPAHFIPLLPPPPKTARPTMEGK